LLQLSAAQMAEPGAAAAQIMRREPVNSGPLRSCFDYVPDRLRRDPCAPKLAHPVHPPENSARGDLGGCAPAVNSSFHPNRDRNRADMLSFANQVSDDPVLLPNLKILRLERDQLGAAQSATNQDRKNRPVTFGS